MKHEMLLRKDNSSENFVKLLVEVNVSSYQVSLSTKFQTYLITWIYKKKVN